jgi:sec-independent protein translocase protein TatC
MSAENEIEDSSAPLIEHLAELRNRLIHSAVAFVIGMVICFTVWNPIFNFLTNPLCSALAEAGHDDCGLILIKLQEGFFVAISISLLGGLVLSFPYIAFQMWRFVAPGLYRNEKGAFLPFLIASPVMFFLGASFAFYVVTPLAFDFFLGFQQPGTVLGEDQVENATAGIAFQGSAQEYLSLTIKFIVAFGLCFQLPVLLTLMGKAGLVSSEGLGAVRKYAVVAILVLAALVTPPDIITQVILFVVVYGLYEISIWLVRRVETKREERLRAEGYYDDEDENCDDPEAEADADLAQDHDDPLMREFDEYDAQEKAEEAAKNAKSKATKSDGNADEDDDGMIQK